MTISSTDALDTIRTARDNSAASWNKIINKAQMDVDQAVSAEKARDACLKAYDHAIEMLEEMKQDWRLIAEMSIEEALMVEVEWGDSNCANKALEALRECSDHIDGDISNLMLVETMPAHLRESHRAANNWGVYPDNGAERILMTRASAEEVDANDEYDWIVRPAVPGDDAKYETRG